MRVTSPPQRFVAISLIESAAYGLVPTRWIHATVLPLPNFPAKHTIAMVRGLQHRQLLFQHQNLCLARISQFSVNRLPSGVAHAGPAYPDAQRAI